jgi:hypothetical protein
MEAVEAKLNSGCPYFDLSGFRILMRFRVFICMWSLPTNYERYVSLLTSVLSLHNMPVQTGISCVADSKSFFRQAVGILEWTTGLVQDTYHCAINGFFAKFQKLKMAWFDWLHQ